MRRILDALREKRANGKFVAYSGAKLATKLTISNGQNDRLIRNDEYNYECGCGWRFAISGNELSGWNDKTDETTFDVFS